MAFHAARIWKNHRTLWFVSLLLAVALMLALAPGPAAAGAIATGARVGGDETRTRFVADLSQMVGYTVYVLPDPYRVVIDMSDVTFNLPPGIGQEARGLISQYRYGEVGTGKSRIVMDTTGPVLIEKSFLVEPKDGQPARIVVDLVKTSEEAFQKTFKDDASKSIASVTVGEATPGPQDEAAAPLPISKTTAEFPKHKDKKLVVIDPGHGGVDPGAIGVNGTKEKDVVLAFGLSLRDLLLKTGQYDVVMTRSEDRFVTLANRVQIARENSADLFIAIHADTIHGRQTRGATIYTLSAKASDAEAEALAQKENRADIIGGVDLGGTSPVVSDILIDLAQRESKIHSVVFAKKVVVELKTVTGFTGKPMRSAGFVVLKAPDVPSVLVELGYLSSRRDEAQLVAESWRNKVASAMATAIDKYFATQLAASGN
jgi:N-acetylmuramoyl-L-alanine amidase